MTSPTEKKAPKKGLGSITLGNITLRLLAMMCFWASGSWLTLNMWADGYWQFAAIVLVVTLMVTIIWLRPQAYPLRWMSPGLAFMILVSAYPILYTVYISFTNFGTGHILPKVQAVQVLAQRQFLPETGAEYEFSLYQSPDGEYALLLQAATGETTDPIVVVPGGVMDLESAGGCWSAT